MGTATTWAGGGVAVHEATAEQLEAARTPYVEAKKAFDAGNFESAAKGFEASYDVVASPNSLLMWAKSLESRGRLADAYRVALRAVPEAEAAAAQDEKYQRTAKDARTLADTLSGQLGYLTVQLPPGQTGPVTVAGRTVAPAEIAQPVAVDPGEVVVTYTGQGGLVERRVTLSGGGTAVVDLGQADVAPPPPEGIEEGRFDIGVPRAVGIGLGGVGVAGMVLFGVFGAMTSSKFSSLEDACTPEGACPPSAQADLDDGKTFQTVANVSLVVGVTGLIAGTALFLLEPEIVGGEEPAAASLRLTVGPTALGLKGSF